MLNPIIASKLAPAEMPPGGMDDLVDDVSDYDEGLHSLGYSVYYYASGYVPLMPLN